MTKQEIIKKEWGSFYTDKVTDDGWLRINPNAYSNNELFDRLKFNSERNLIRPKSLQGIENNNGWIKIQSEYDLPNDIDGLWEVVINGEQKFIELLKDNKERLYKDFLKDGITHYKICNKSQPPLY